MSRIQLPLFSLHAGVHAFLQLIRQIRENVLFQPPQNKGANHFPKLLHGLFILTLNHRYLNIRPKVLISVQKSGHQIIEYAPKLA